MATAIGASVFFKTATGYLPAIVTRAYDVNGAVVDALATTDTSIVKADLLVLSYAPTKVSLATKEVTVAGSDGAIAAGSNVLTTIASMVTGTWFTLT